MKKAALHNIIFASISISVLMVLIFTVQEIILLSRIINTEKEINTVQNQSRITEQLQAVCETDEMLVKNTFVLKDKKEFSVLLKKHKQNANKFFKLHRQLFALSIQDNQSDKLTALIKLIEKTNQTYKEEANPLIESLINTKYKLAETAPLEDESFDLQLNNFLVIEKQIEESFKILKNNIQSLQKILNKNEHEKLKEKKKLLNNTQKTILVFLLLTVLLGFILFRTSSKYFFEPLSRIIQFLTSLAKGELPDKLHIKYGKEPIEIAALLNKVNANLAQAVKFSEDLSENKFNQNYRSEGSRDLLGNALLKLQENLLKSMEEESLLKEEEIQRQRTNEGLSLFSDLLRKHSDNIYKLADDVISALVNFTEANQGVLFFLNDEDKNDIFYELAGAYAYNRKKYLSGKIYPGEGLVGAVVLEKYTVYITEVPEDYVNIESGTGKANPRSILIVPLKFEEKVLGVIELASFNEFKKEDIAMIEEFADSIAFSFSSTKINTETSKLNKELQERVKLLQQTEKELGDSLLKIKKLEKKIAALKKENQRLKAKN